MSTVWAAKIEHFTGRVVSEDLAYSRLTGIRLRLTTVFTNYLPASNNSDMTASSLICRQTNRTKKAATIPLGRTIAAARKWLTFTGPTRTDQFFSHNASVSEGLSDFVSDVRSNLAMCVSRATYSIVLFSAAGLAVASSLLQ